MGGAASKAQEDHDHAAPTVVARTKSSGTRNHHHRPRRPRQHQQHHQRHQHHHRSRRQHPHRSSSANDDDDNDTPPPPGIPTQAQFGYLIQQIGEDPNQVQVTPGYYYASYDQSKRRHRSQHRRYNSEPTSSSSQRSHYQPSRDRDSKSSRQHRGSGGKRHGSRRNTEPTRMPTTATRVGEQVGGGEIETVDDDDEHAGGDDTTAQVPLGNESEDRRDGLVLPPSRKKSSHSVKYTTTTEDAEYEYAAKKRRENPLPDPPRNVYETTDKYHRLKRSQTVDSTGVGGPSNMGRERSGTVERSVSESDRRRRPRVRPPPPPAAASLPEDLVPTTKSAVLFDSRGVNEKKLPKPPIKDRVFDRLFGEVVDNTNGGGPSSSSRKGPLSVLRSITLPAAFNNIQLPLKKKTALLLSRTESGRRSANSNKPVDQPPPYAPPISIPLSSPLNPASPHEVVYRKKTYPTAAHLFEAHKFLKHSPELAERLRMVNESPYEMGKLSYSFQMEGMVREDWELVWRDKLDEVLWLKFNQHHRLRDELLATGYALLLDGNEVRHADPDTPGVNELGKAYMRLRDRLRMEADL